MSAACHRPRPPRDLGHRLLGDRHGRAAEQQEVHERLQRKYEHGWSTEIEADTVPVGDEQVEPGAEEDDKLPVLYETIKNAAHAIRSGARSFDKVARTARLSLSRAGLEVDYFYVLDEDTLQPASSSATWSGASSRSHR